MNDNSLTVENIWGFDANGAYETNNQSSNSKFKHIYKPAMGKEGVKRYISLLKFLPYAKDVNKSIICKRELYLTDPHTKQGRTIDIPMLNGNVKSIILTAYKLCNASENLRIKDLTKNFSSYTQYFSLVQIIEDTIHPELNEQLKIFKFGDTIHKMILEARNPSSKYKESNNIFDLKNGKLFQLNITKNSNNPNQGDYSACEFLEKTMLPIIDGKECKDSERILKLLTEEAPDLSEHEYREWDSNTTKYVADCIYKIFPRDCKELNVLITEFPEIMSSTLNGYANVMDDDEVTVLKSKDKKQSDIEDVFGEDEVTQKPKKEEPEPPKKASRVVEDDDDEDEQLDNFMDEEDEKPKIKKKPSKIVEEEEEIDLDIEEDEKPKKSTKKSTKKDDDEIDFNDLIGDDE